MKQRPSWLMWCCFDASRLTSFGLSAVCCQGNRAKPESFPPNWPLEEDRGAKNQAKAGCHGRRCCCCLRLALPPSLACLAYRRRAGGCGQPHQALVQIKQLLAKVFVVQAESGLGNRAWEPGVRVDSQSSSLAVWPLQVDLLSWSGPN